MEESKEQKIQNKLFKLIGEMTNKQFNKWICSWFDEQEYLDIIKDWDSDTQEKAIKEITKLIKH